MLSLVIRQGKIIDLENMRPEDIDILDIANALGNTCRWSGQVSRFYSVAEHSVIVSRLVSPQNALWGLLHDAGEAYLSDLVAPIKAKMPGYVALETNVMRAICLWAGLPEEMPAEVNDIDLRLRVNEACELGLRPELWGGQKGSPLPAHVAGWMPDYARIAFLGRWKELRKAA